MAEVGTAFLSIVPSARGFGAALSSEVGPQMDAAGKTSGKRMSAGMKAGLLAGAAVVGAAVGKFIGDSIAEAQESAKIAATTEQIVKSTGGAANVSAAAVGKLATAISTKTGIDDEAVQTGANLLLTFKNVANEAGKGNKIFDQATAAAVDLSAAGFGSIDSASKMLGKALNDPVKGMTALSRAGVTFTQTQKDQVAEMVKSGDLLGAQKVILAEVQSQVGGVAAAQATGAQKMATAWGNFKEAIGAQLLPVITAVTNALTPLIQKITASPPALLAVAIILGGALAGAFIAAAVAAWAFVAPMLIMAAPFILIGIAIAALIAAIVVLVKNWDVVKEKTAAAWDAIKAKLASAWESIKSTVVKKGEEVLQWFKDLPKKMLALFVGANMWLISVGEGIINGLIKGIGNGFTWVKTKITQLGKNVLTWAREILGIGSPSKAMAKDVGRWIPAGIAAGIDANAGAVHASMAALTSDLSVNARVSARTGANVTSPAAPATGPTQFYLKSGELEIINGQAYIEGIITEQAFASTFGELA